MMDSSNAKQPYDVTILYMEDAREWCEYLFDIFQPFDVYMQSEEITTFPTHFATLEAIRTSRVQVLIISPVFLQNIDSNIEKVTDKVVALLCGVEEEELKVLKSRVPTYGEWHLVEAQSDPRPLSQKTLALLDGVCDSDEEDLGEDPVEGPGEFDSNYEDMTKGRKNDGNDYVLKDEINEETYVPITGPIRIQDEKMEYIYDIKELPSSEYMTVVPSRVDCDKDENIYILFKDETLATSEEYTVAFKGSIKQSYNTGRAINPYTLVIETPKNHPSETVEVVVCHDSEQLGKSQLSFVNALDQLENILQETVNPIQLMCDSLHIYAHDVNSLDDALYSRAQEIANVESLERCLLIDQDVQEEKIDKLYPTALHFAAHFGLKKVTSSYLTKLPGARQAMKLKNKDGHTPADMAGINKHSDLKDLLEQILHDPQFESPLPGYAHMVKIGPKYVNTNDEAKPEYDKPCRVPVPLQQDMTQFRKVMEDGMIYDVFYPLDHTRDQKDVDEDYDSGKEDYEELPKDEELVGPTLPGRMTPNAPPSLLKKLSVKETKSKEQAVDEGQQALLEINQAVKRGEITVDESMERFTEWQKKFNQYLPRQVAPSKKHVDKKKTKHPKKGTTPDESPGGRPLLGSASNPYNTFGSGSGRLKVDPAGKKSGPNVSKRPHHKSSPKNSTHRRSFMNKLEDLTSNELPSRVPPPIPHRDPPGWLPDRAAPPPPLGKSIVPPPVKAATSRTDSQPLDDPPPPPAPRPRPIPRPRP